MILYEHFVANLQAAMDERNISQTELARRTGLDRGQISRLLSGVHTNPTLNFCELCAIEAGMNPLAAFVPPAKTPARAY